MAGSSRVPPVPLLARRPVRELGLHAAIPECRRPRCTARPRSQDGKAMTVTTAAPAGAVTRQLAGVSRRRRRYDDLPPDVLHETLSRHARLVRVGAGRIARATRTFRPGRRAQSRRVRTTRPCSAPDAHRPPLPRSRTAWRRTSSSSTTSTKGSTLHAAAPVIPAALAVAERERASGRAFSLAVAVGYDAALAHRRSGQSESLPLLASDGHRGDVRRGRGGRLAARAHAPRRCSTRSAAPARRRRGCGSSTPTAR